MEKTYCLKDERKTPCTEPSGFQKDKRGCAVCGTRKVRYIKENGQMGTGKGTKKVKKVGGDVFDTVVGLEQRQMLLFIMVFPGWQKSLLKRDDMEQINKYYEK